MSSSREREGKGGEESSGEGGKEKKTSPWEWVVGVVSALLVLGAAGFMMYEGFTAPESPPRITLQVDTVIEAEHGYVVEFRASNEGYSTAAGLLVQGELKSDTGTVETSEATIDYVPSQSHRSGGLFFSEDPRRYTLELRPKGYDRP